MFISIFIPTGNRGRSLKKVLDSLSSQTYRDFEVIVVDYKSKDNTFSIIKSFGDKFKIKIIKQEEKGLAKAANLALGEAEGEVFIRTDDDVILDENWLKSIAKTFKDDKKVGGVTGPTIVPKEYLQNRDLFIIEEKFRKGNLFWRMVGKFYFGFIMEGQPYRVSHWFGSGAFSLGSNFPAAQEERRQKVNNLEACNFSVKTELLRKIGGFSEAYGGLGEYHEPDASFRIMEMGYDLVFDPSASLRHCPSRDGFFKERPSSYSRMVNFIVFYLRNIKIDSFSKFIRFFSYVIFQNCYYCYQFAKTGQVSLLGSIPASLTAFIKYYNENNSGKK